jgi:Reverse transcriptase (RNA-dependent DNA polymerase)
LRNKHTNLPLIVTEDLNVNLNQHTFNPRHQEIFETLQIIGINNMIKHFRQRRHFKDGTTWRQFRDGEHIKSTCDYVLSNESRKRFKRIRITNPRHFDSDHFAISFSLFAKRPKQHQQYLRRRRAFPLHFDQNTETEADQLLHQFPLTYRNHRHIVTFTQHQPNNHPSSPPEPNLAQDFQDQEHNQAQQDPNIIQDQQDPQDKPLVPLQDQPQHLPHIPVQHQLNVQPTRHKSWVSEYTWRLIDQRASMRRHDIPPDNQRVRHLSQQIRKSLKRDRKRRTILAGEEIQALLDDNDSRGAWQILRRWYRQVNSKVTKPSLVDMDHIHTTFHNLYQRDHNLPEPALPIQYVPTPVPDDIPNDFEITLAIQKLRKHKAPGPSGLQTENVLHWMRDPDQANWNNLIKLIQHVFVTGEIPQRLAFSTLVLLPKPDGGVRGIGLLETIWKIISIIIKDRLVDTIQFDDSLHGFLPRRGTATAIIKAKLRLDTTIAAGTTIYQVFMDLTKAYDSVSREKLLSILSQYGVGPHIITILNNFWNQLKVAPKQGGFYGKPTQTQQGVTQGDPLSPILFNIVVDAVVRETKRLQGPINSHIIFYADDGLITGTNLQDIQQYLNIITELYSRIGLKTNANKTKVLVGRPEITNHRICSPVFNQRFGGSDPSYSEYKKQPVESSICKLVLQRVSLPRHMINQHIVYELPTRRNSVTPYFQQQPQTYQISMDNQNYVD